MLGGLLALALLAGCLQFPMGLVFGKIDSPQPQYTVLATKADYEVRRYGSILLAEVRGNAGSKKEFDSANFRVLAQYIGVFGTPMNTRKGGAGAEKMEMTAPVISSGVNSKSSETIPMTAPVLSSGSATTGEEYKLAFVLPQQYTLASAPVPLNTRVNIREVSARIVAVHRFSGNCPDSECVSKMEMVRSKLKEDGFILHPSVQEGQYELARYNPPFTIPFLKTNEIHLELDEKTAPPAAKI